MPFLAGVWEELGNTMGTLWPYYGHYGKMRRCSELEATEVDSLAVDWPGKRHVESRCVANFHSTAVAAVAAVAAPRSYIGLRNGVVRSWDLASQAPNRS